MQSVTRPRDLRARIVIGAVLPLLLAISACSATKAPSSKPAQEAGYIVVTMQPQLERLFGDDLLQRRGLAQPLTSSVVAARAVSPAKRRLPASRNSFDHT